MNNRMIAAIFDCDGTIYSARFGRGLLKYASDHGGEKAVRSYYAALLVPHLLRKFKIISQEAYQKPLIEKLAWLVKGWDEKESQAGFSWVVHEYLLKTGYEEVLRRLKDHQARGHHVILISGVLTPALEILGAHLDTDATIGTKIEEQDGVYTGRIIPPVISGDVKAREARAYFASNLQEIDWAGSFAYADSLIDRPILDMVGNPVMVSPDPGLLKVGQGKGWEMLGEPKQDGS
jgi:HAD superfamily hydrolase (TIGR01490 family)